MQSVSYYLLSFPFHLIQGQHVSLSFCLYIFTCLPFVDIFRYQNSRKYAGLRIMYGPGFQHQFFTDYATISKSVKPPSNLSFTF